MLRGLGVVFFIFIILAGTLHLSGAVTVALMFYGGCAAILLGLIIRSVLRHWW